MGHRIGKPLWARRGCVHDARLLNPDQGVTLKNRTFLTRGIFFQNSQKVRKIVLHRDALNTEY